MSASADAHVDTLLYRMGTYTKNTLDVCCDTLYMHVGLVMRCKFDGHNFTFLISSGTSDLNNVCGTYV